MHLRILTSFLVLATFPVFGQNVEEKCDEIELIAPERSFPWNQVSIKAVVSKAPVKGDWLIVKENFQTKATKIEKIRNTESVDLIAWQSNDSGSITAIITVPPTKQCRAERYATATVVLTENPGTPLILDEFGIINERDQKARLDLVADFMEKSPKDELLIFMSFRRSDVSAKRMRTIRSFVEHLSELRKLPKDRITFLIEEAETFSVRFQPFPQNLASVYTSTHLEIKAERLDEYERLFK
ncbi:MAG: hypothetical protein KF831_14610 [Acidobacteria bacterium]|nr:hypothetical protein [Acidobacteriota bacterium]